MLDMLRNFKYSHIFPLGINKVFWFWIWIFILLNLFSQTSSPNSSNENSPVSPPDEQGQSEGPPQMEEEEPAFPHTDLAKLDDMINRYLLSCWLQCCNICHSHLLNKTHWTVERFLEQHYNSATFLGFRVLFKCLLLQTFIWN